MGELKSKILFVCVFVLLFGAAPVALGDWDVGDGHKMHYPQLPKPGGWDVALWSEGSVWLADDWQCSETGPVEDIHFWVSWEDDMVSPIGGFSVRIWSDNPVGPGGYSEPNELLWERDFDAGQFTVRDMPDDLQGWFDPFSGSVSPDDHIMWQQINIVDISDPWIQKEGKIYWLMIDMGAPYCGWKESGSPHFRDNGVYWDGLKWVKLVDPMSQESLDLAFVITGAEYVKHKNLKWSQPPIEWDPNDDIPTYCGWDELSYTVDPDFDWLIVADDFRCLGTMPVTSIHWWGSHLGWEEPGSMPQDLPIAWRIGFWSNVPAEPTADPNYSYPEKLLWQIEVPADRVDVEEVGSDEYPEIPYYDICYQYYLDLERDEWFWQNKYETQDHIYWLSIAAIYDPDVEDPQFLWGWKTRPWSWMDDGVRFWVDENLVPGMLLDPGLNMIEPIIDPLSGESFDLAFELDTDPCYVKHEQPFTGIRDWPHYEDEWSMAMRETRSKWGQWPDQVGWDVAFEYTDGSPLELADDWQCDETGTIDDIHFWLSWESDEVGDINAVTVKIYSNDPCGPGNFSEPNELKWSRTFSRNEFYWTWYDSGMQGWLDPSGDDWLYPDHAEYYYLSIDDINDPFIQQEGDIYWLSIELEPNDASSGYAGWKTTTSPWQDVAVWRAPGDPWEMLEEPIMGLPLDLAFELTTSELVIDRLVADDWPCDGNEPVSAAVWWGSYIGYRYAACDIDGPRMDPPVPPDYFLLNIWTDVPVDSTDPTSYSHPNDIIWEYNAYDYDEVLVGYDKHPEDPDPDGEGREPVFRYSVRLPKKDWFYQDEPNNVYWFSVVAVYEESLPNYDWGWTNHEHVYNEDANDDAVAGHPNEPEPGSWWWEELYDQTGVSEDMSFILFNSCPCWGDVSDTTGFGPPDGVVDIGDLNYTLMAMFAVYPAGDPTGLYTLDPVPPGLECIDVSDTTGFGPPDGVVDIGDLNYVLMAMFAVYPAGDSTGLYQIPCL